jgi:type IV secretion system protein VirB8
VKQDAALATYFAEAASWDADRVALERHRARMAWTVASVALSAALAAIGAIVLMMPLKRVEPFVIRVDNTSGLVDVVPVYTGTAVTPELVTRYLLTHYVVVCQRFNFATAESDYQECGAFNSAAQNQQWAHTWALSNPESPLNLFKDGSTTQARVLSVTFFQRANRVSDLAQVRYLTSRRSGEGSEEHLTHWIATVQYTYTKPSTDLVQRQWNPLGLRILDFHAEPEAPAPAAASPAALSAKSGGLP